MTRTELIAHIQEKKSFLCVGLDPDIDRIPSHLGESKDWIFEFNKAIIDAVADHCVAFKPNTAFYECHGTWGWEQFERTVAYIRAQYPHHFVIADAKRGDIGNTSRMYAKTFFDHMDCHAVTVAPYMGEDSVRPFLEFEGKWTIVLGLTSNQGAQDFQYIGEPDLYLQVMEKVAIWGTPDNLMFVAGATRGQQLAKVRSVAPEHFLLVPGVGAQGGSLSDVTEHAALSQDIGLLVNSSRGIIYAGSGEDYSVQAADAARSLSEAMSLHF